MDVRAAALLPLKAELVVTGTEDANVESIDELEDKLVGEPVGDRCVLLDCFAASRAGIRII